MRLTGPQRTIRNAKRLRRELTLPEIILWRELRRLPIRFRKQHPAGPYVLDFYCAARKLAVEVDGEAHDRGDRPARDATRDAWLAGQGVRAIRVTARDVLRDLDAVMRLISAELGVCGEAPSVALRAPPPPVPGEE